MMRPIARPARRPSNSDSDSDSDGDDQDTPNIARLIGGAGGGPNSTPGQRNILQHTPIFAGFMAIGRNRGRYDEFGSASPSGGGGSPAVATAIGDNGNGYDTGKAIQRPRGIPSNRSRPVAPTVPVGVQNETRRDERAVYRKPTQNAEAGPSRHPLALQLGTQAASDSAATPTHPPRQALTSASDLIHPTRQLFKKPRDRHKRPRIHAPRSSLNDGSSLFDSIIIDDDDDTDIALGSQSNGDTNVPSGGAGGGDAAAGSANGISTPRAGPSAQSALAAIRAGLNGRSGVQGVGVSGRRVESASDEAGPSRPRIQPDATELRQPSDDRSASRTTVQARPRPPERLDLTRSFQIPPATRGPIPQSQASKGKGRVNTFVHRPARTQPTMSKSNLAEWIDLTGLPDSPPPDRPVLQPTSAPIPLLPDDVPVMRAEREEGPAIAEGSIQASVERAVRPTVVDDDNQDGVAGNDGSGSSDPTVSATESRDAVETALGGIATVDPIRNDAEPIVTIMTSATGDAPRSPTTPIGNRSSSTQVETRIDQHQHRDRPKLSSPVRRLSLVHQTSDLPTPTSPNLRNATDLDTPGSSMEIDDAQDVVQANRLASPDSAIPSIIPPSSAIPPEECTKQRQRTSPDVGIVSPIQRISPGSTTGKDQQYLRYSFHRQSLDVMMKSDESPTVESVKKPDDTIRRRSIRSPTTSTKTVSPITQRRTLDTLPSPAPTENGDNQPSTSSISTVEPAAVSTSTDLAIPAPAEGDLLPDGSIDLLRQFGLFCPTMKGRKDNKWTSWSNKIVPGTLHDLMWQLDKIYGGTHENRFIMRWFEEDVIWGNMRHISDKRRFIFCCWYRWFIEHDAIMTHNPVPYVRGFIDQYGEILRFGGLDQEVLDLFHILYCAKILRLETTLNASAYWNRHMRYYRKIKGCPLPQDDDWSDTDEYVEKGWIRLKEFEPGGRDYEEMKEREKARKEGRRPVLPPKKYVFGEEEEDGVVG